MASLTTKIILSLLLLSLAFFIVALVLTFKVFPELTHLEEVDSGGGGCSNNNNNNNNNGDGVNNGGGGNEGGGNEEVNTVQEHVELVKGTRQYDRFLQMPYDMELRVYIFDVINSEEVLNSGANPQVQEVGPYIYRQSRQKNRIYTDCDDDIIVYTENHQLEFDPVASAPLAETDVHTVLNLPLMTMFQKSEPNNRAQYLYVCADDIFPNGHTLFVRSSVQEMVLGGVTFCKQTGSVTCDVVNRDSCRFMTSNRNVERTDDESYRFSYFSYKQGTDGVYAVKRGVQDLSALGRIHAWNEANYTNYWGEKTTCSAVRGTDSTLFPPQLEQDTNLAIFLSDLCRSLDLDFIQETTYAEIPGYVFGLDRQTLWSSTVDPNEDCFCTKLTPDENNLESCYLDGVLDLQTCVGMPLLLSFPHFLWADERYQNGVLGLQPDEEKHSTSFIIEPKTGSLMHGIKRTQLNTILRPILAVKDFENLPHVILPILWTEESFTLPDQYLDDLLNITQSTTPAPEESTTLEPDLTTPTGPPRIVRDVPEGVGWGLIGIASVLMITFAGILAYRKLF